ncbi:MAG TPA: S26 family signal peptidase [Polyangia bacterium]
MRPRSAAAKALRAGCTIELGARGASMWPLLRTGDRLTVEPAGAASLRRGDVAVVERPHGLVAHRVVAVDPLVTRGDRMAADDLPAGDGAIVGRVRALRRWGIAIELGGRIGRGLSYLSASALTAAAVRALGPLARLRRRLV